MPEPKDGSIDARLGSHSRKGLSAKEAFAHWSDPEKFKELVELAETDELSKIVDADIKIRDPERHKRFLGIRQALEKEFQTRLLNEEIFASGVREFADRCEIIHPTLWGLLFVDFDLEHIGGHGRVYENPEFFTIDCIPQNVRPIPEWLEERLGELGLTVFRHDASYQHIVLHGINYVLSPLHAKIVSILHDAWRADDPWKNGKDILERAGSAQLKMIDVFKTRKDWKAFIEFDGKRMYRLRMELPKQE
jgi:hypothetical protein